jgi:hypothetical protein
MPNAETVVETVQTEAAVDGAQVVAQVAAVGDSIISAEVADVAEVLADHVEQSEERHTEILEGEEWLQNQMGLLLTTIQGTQSNLLAFQTAVLAKLDQLETIVNSRSLTPVAALPPEPIAAVVLEPEIVAPESGVVDRPDQRTPPEPERRKRRII